MGEASRRIERRRVEKLANSINEKIVCDCSSHAEMFYVIGILATSVCALAGPDGEHLVADQLCSALHEGLRMNRSRDN